MPNSIMSSFSSSPLALLAPTHNSTNKRGITDVKGRAHILRARNTSISREEDTSHSYTRTHVFVLAKYSDTLLIAWLAKKLTGAIDAREMSPRQIRYELKRMPAKLNS
jgi:hypothetical protein